MMKRFTELVLAGLLFFAPVQVFAQDQCAPEASEERIKEALTPKDVYFIIEGTELDLFIKNANELYNIGWVREQIARVYIIESETKHENPRFQAVHVFFITPDGCIGHYQGTYAVVIALLLHPNPQELLGSPQVEPVPVEPEDKPGLIAPRESKAPASGPVMRGRAQAEPAVTVKPVIIAGVDGGGTIGTFAMWYERLANAGVRIIVDGQCISACAMIFGLIPQDRVCLTDRAAFGLHMASMDGQPSEDTTVQMVRLFYPTYIQKLVIERGGLKVDELMWLYPEDLKDFYRACTSEELKEAGLFENKPQV